MTKSKQPAHNTTKSKRPTKVGERFLARQSANNPGSEQFDRGKELLKRDDVAGAIRCFDAAIAANLKHPEFFYSRATAHERSGNLQAAVKDLKKAYRLRHPYGYAVIRVEDGKGILQSVYPQSIDGCVKAFNETLGCTKSTSATDLSFWSFKSTEIEPGRMSEKSTTAANVMFPLKDPRTEDTVKKA